MAKWFVVRIRAGRQERAAQELLDADIEYYHPKMRKEIKHHQTKQWITREFPLFTGYVFACLWPADFAKLRGIRDVIGVLGDGAGCPIPVSSKVVFDIMDAQERGDFDEMRPARRRLRPGAHVEIKDGILAGHYTTVTSVVGKRAIKAVVDFFGTHREVEIGVENVRMVA